MALAEERPDLLPLLRLILVMGDEEFNEALRELEKRGLPAGGLQAGFAQATIGSAVPDDTSQPLPGPDAHTAIGWELPGGFVDGRFVGLQSQGTLAPVVSRIQTGTCVRGCSVGDLSA